MTAPRLAWGLFGLWALLSGTGAALAVVGGDPSGAGFLIATVAIAAVGALVASRQPGNRVGWLLLAVVLALSLTNLTEGLVAVSDEPLNLVLWLDGWFFYVWIGLVGVFVPLLFPDGRLPARRWRLVAWAGALSLVLTLAGRGFGRRELDSGDPNPFALPGFIGRVLRDVAVAGDVLLALAVVGALASVAVRLRRSRGVERQQLKWFAYVAVLMLVAALASFATLIGGFEQTVLASVAWFSFLGLAILALPAAIGVAILRHRLYDVDVVINRTLVYGALTATLAAAYLGMVLLLGLAVGRGSPVAVAVSTLTVAALSRPARTRIQLLVDRRFYRQRYDAGSTLDAFGLRLRDEVELDAVAGDLRGVAREALQPAHVSVWLR